MEGKTMILSVLVISLVMGQIQLGAADKLCCKPSSGISGQFKFAACCAAYVAGGGLCNIATCLKAAECQYINDYQNCWDFYPPSDNLENSGDAATEYCKLGCASYVCGAITTLQKYDASKIVNGAVEKCTKTCSTLCTKGSTTAVETA